MAPLGGAAFAWLAGVGYGLAEPDPPSVASLYWALAVLLAVGGVAFHLAAGSRSAVPVRDALVIVLATAAIGFLGAGHAENVGVSRDVFAAQIVLPALLFALTVLALGGRFGLWSRARLSSLRCRASPPPPRSLA